MICKPLYLLLFCALSMAAAGENAYQFSFLPKAGRYSVGLKVVNQYDYERTYRSTIDSLGHPSQGELARPVQTLFWYPAMRSSLAPVTFGDYLRLRSSEEDFSPSPARIAAAERKSQEFADCRATPMKAVREAKPAPGQYPVVIYAPSFGAPAFENVDLCEYWASHGYIVLASPDMGTHSRPMTADLTGINTQAQDISFLISFARTLPEADLSHIAVAGFSWGGISNLFAAARDSRIDALVSLDGSARYYSKLVADSGDVHPEEVSIPTLFFTQGEITLEDLERFKLSPAPNVLNQLKHADLTTIHMHGMRHGDFSSLFQRSPEYWKQSPPKEYSRKEAAESYGWVARYTLAFLDATLKQDASSMSFLRKSPVENGAPNHLFTVEFRPASGVPPTAEAFRAELAKSGFDRVAQVYAQMKTQNPEFKLEEDTVDQWGHTLLDDGHLAEAVDVLKLNASLHPDSSNAYESLAEAYQVSRQTALAIENYKSALEKNPKNEHAQSELKKLEAGQSLPEK